MTTKILRRWQVEALTGLSRSTIYLRMNSASPHSDPAFPKSINLGGGAVGWIESEVQDWIAGCISASRGGEDGKLVKVINPVSNLT